MMKFIYITINLLLLSSIAQGQTRLIESVAHPASIYIYSEEVQIKGIENLDTDTPLGMLSQFMKDSRNNKIDDLSKYYIETDLPKQWHLAFRAKEMVFQPIFNLTVFWNGQKQVFIRGLLDSDPVLFTFALEGNRWKLFLTNTQTTRETHYFLIKIKLEKFYSLLQGNLNNNPLEKQILDIVTDQNGYINLTSLFSLAYNTWHLDEGKKYGYYFFGTPLD